MSKEKEGFSSQLENHKNNLIIGLAAVSVLIDPRASEILRECTVKTGAYTIPFEQVAELLICDSDKEIALKEFLLMLFRTSIKEGFELVKTYAESTGQMDDFRNFECFPFLRQMRNAVSHDFQWDLKDRKGNFYKELPISWSGVELNKSHHNKPVELQHIGWPKMLELILELGNEARSKLK